MLHRTFQSVKDLEEYDNWGFKLTSYTKKTKYLCVGETTYLGVFFYSNSTNDREIDKKINQAKQTTKSLQNITE